MKSHVSPPRSETVVLFDRTCPLCRGEMYRLKRRDFSNKLRLIDLFDPAFDASIFGIDRAAASAALHVRNADGVWLVGMPAIRHVYRQVGLGWLLAPSGWPCVTRLADHAYRRFARNRIVISKWLGLLPSERSCEDGVCDSCGRGGRPS